MTPQLSWQVACWQRHELDRLVPPHPLAAYHRFRFGARRRKHR